MARASQVVLSENEYYLIKAPNGKVLEAGEGRWRIQNRFTGKMIDLVQDGVVEGTWLHQWTRTSGLSQCWVLEPLRNGRTRIRSALANKYIDLVGMNTSNGAQAQIWLEVPGGNQEWNLERVDDITARTAPRTDEAAYPHMPPPRRGQDDLVRKLNQSGKGRGSRKGSKA